MSKEYFPQIGHISYEEAKPYYYIEEVDDHEYLANLVRATCAVLPEPKPKVPKGKKK